MLLILFLLFTAKTILAPPPPSPQKLPCSPSINFSCFLRVADEKSTITSIRIDIFRGLDHHNVSGCNNVMQCVSGNRQVQEWAGQ
ncbi:hypothetical protein F4680DRAFT_429122 [Xylaria scruposa]|nr:hypothetical protein F4680DRAFT_429122 [Xylaria scruposa]